MGEVDWLQAALNSGCELQSVADADQQMHRDFMFFADIHGYWPHRHRLLEKYPSAQQGIVQFTVLFSHLHCECSSTCMTGA